MAPYLENITQKLGKVTEWAFLAKPFCAERRRGSKHNQPFSGYTWERCPVRESFELFPANRSEREPDLRHTHMYWFALTDTRYVKWEQIIFQQRTMPGGTFTGAMEALKPDYLVVDGYMQQYTFDDDFAPVQLTATLRAYPGQSRHSSEK